MQWIFFRGMRYFYLFHFLCYFHPFVFDAVPSCINPFPGLVVNRVSCVAFSPCGTYLAIGEDQSAHWAVLFSFVSSWRSLFDLVMYPFSYSSHASTAIQSCFDWRAFFTPIIIHFLHVYICFTILPCYFNEQGFGLFSPRCCYFRPVSPSRVSCYDSGLRRPWWGNSYNLNFLQGPLGPRAASPPSWCGIGRPTPSLWPPFPQTFPCTTTRSFPIPTGCWILSSSWNWHHLSSFTMYADPLFGCLVSPVGIINDGLL